ncbi:hypothetical protein LRP88_12968 [Fusarium phalaenopsidis]
MLDSDDDSDAIPDSAGPALPAKTLSTKILYQLQYESCLTNDVLHFLSTVVFARHRGLHPPGARVHLKDPLWFDADAPPSLPRFLFQDKRLKDAIIYMPAHIDTNHRVLVRIVDCARHFDAVSCGIFVIVTFDRLLQCQSPSLQIEPRVERARLLDMISVIKAPFLSLDYEQLQAISEAQTVLRPPTTLSVQAGLNDAETGSAYEAQPSVANKDIEISAPTYSLTTLPTASASALELGTSSNELLAGLKRKTLNEDEPPGPTTNKRHNPIAPDLTSKLVQTIADKTRSRKAEKVGTATCRLNDANTTLSKAETTLNEAQDALEYGEAIEPSSSDKRAAFPHWLSQAPVDITAGAFGFAIQGATQGARAFLDQYLSTVRESMMQLVANAANAARQVDEPKAIVKARRGKLEAAMEDKGSHESDLQQLGSLLGRLLD